MVVFLNFFEYDLGFVWLLLFLFSFLLSSK